jgi:hypothetical protein
MVEFVIIDANLARFHRNLRQPFNRKDQQILQRGHIRLFTAYTDFGAALSF